MYNRRTIATEDNLGMSQNVGKYAFPFLKIAVTLLFFYDRLQVFAFIVSRKMKLVPSLMCILIPLSALLCNRQVETNFKVRVPQG